MKYSTFIKSGLFVLSALASQAYAQNVSLENTVSFANQDTNTGEVTLQSDGTLLLKGNRWHATQDVFTVTPTTVLEFEFASDSTGQIHGIGLDEDNSISSARIFSLMGTQNWGIRNVVNYTETDGSFQQYAINIGEYYTGDNMRVVFVNDNDVSNPVNTSLFRNVKVVDSSTIPTPTPTPTATPIPEPTPTPIGTPVATPSPSPSPTPVPTATPISSDSQSVLDCGPRRGSLVNGKLDQEAKDYLLCKHNETRSKTALNEMQGAAGLLPAAGNMARLVWDNELEQVAQDYADQCVWGHNSNRTAEYSALNPTDIHGNPVSGRVSVGENIAAGGSFNPSVVEAFNGYDNWEAEVADYSFGALNVSDFCGDVCGHFTQIVWAKTFKVGCAASACPSGTVFDRFASTYLVCNYSQSGNFLRQEPYISVDSAANVCSQSEAGQTECSNGLTSLPK